MTFEPAAHLLAFVLPMSFKKGEVTFIASRTGEDVRVPIAPGDRPRHVISTAKLPKGVWRAFLRWSDGSIQYHEEKQIVVL